MAGNENSGGYRPTAPQNNPANVSATGGAGTSGDYTGFAYGMNKQLNDQKAAAPITPQAPTTGGMDFTGGAQLGTLLDETRNPNEPVTAGADVGPGPGSDALPSNINANTRPDETQMIIQKYMPTLMQAASLQDAPDSYKRFVNYLLGK